MRQMFQNKTKIVMAAVSRRYLLYLLLRRTVEELVIWLYLQRQSTLIKQRKETSLFRRKKPKR